MHDDLVSAEAAVATVTDQIKDAVRMALLEERVRDHGIRLKVLENFRWWLLAGIAAAAGGSWLSLLMNLAAHPSK